jgi:hypothetical protein
MLYPILLWSIYITHLDRTIWIRGFGIPVLAYGFTAFWLEWSYLKITLRNMQFVSTEGNLWSRWVALAFVVVFLLLSDKFARGKKHRAWFTFLAGALGFFTINTLGNHYLNFRIIGEPSRLVPEFDLVCILMVAELLRRLWSADGPWRKPRIAAAAILALVFLAPSWRYIANAHTIFVRDPDYRQRVEYQLQDWVAKNLPGSRTLPAGSVRFWYNVWNDLPQVGGGSEQGLLNPRIVPAQWQIYLGPEADMSVMWLQLLGADAVIVNAKNSREHYKDYVFPDKFDGVLPVLYDNGEGDTIYGVPRRFRSLARVVDRGKFDKLPEIPGNGEMPYLKTWHDTVEEGAIAEAPMTWYGTDSFRIKAEVGEGQSVWIQESYDLNWHAWSGEQRLPVRKDNLGFMIIDVPPGRHDILMRFPTPVAIHLGRLVTLFSFLITGWLVWRARRG